MFIKKGLWGRVHGHGPKQGCRGGVGLGYMGAGGAGAGDGGIATHHAQIASQWPDWNLRKCRNLWRTVTKRATYGNWRHIACHHLKHVFPCNHYAFKISNAITCRPKNSPKAITTSKKKKARVIYMISEVVICDTKYTNAKHLGLPR